MAEKTIEQPQRLSDVMQMQNAEDEPEVMRLGDVLSMEKVETSELNEGGFFQVTGAQEKEWKDLGPIGYFEQAIRQDKTEMIPFNPEAAVKSIKLLNAVNRIKRNRYDKDPGQKDMDIQRTNNFLRMSEEERIRGYTIGGRITQGVGALPGFMIEFLATGGVAALGKKAIKKTVAGVTRKIVKNRILKFTTRLAGGVAGAVARTAAMPHRVIESYANRQINATLELTDKGMEIAQESREKPFVSFSKAFGDVVIENFSEVVGPTLGKVGSKIIPKRMANTMVKLFKKLHPNEAINKLFVKAGYHGFLEELGEERVGALLRAVFNVEDFGAKDADRMFDRIMASIPNGEEMLVEAGVLSFPGVTKAGVQQMMKVIQDRRQEAGQEVGEPDLPEEITDEQIEEILATEPEEAIPGAVEGVEGAKPRVEGVVEEIPLEEAEKPIVEEPAKVPIPEEEKQLLEDIKELEERKLYGKVPRIIKKETTILREKIANIERGIREGRITTKKEIKETQTAIIRLLESTELEAADRAKFIRTIKNIQTPEELREALPEIKTRISRLEIAAEKRDIAERIKRELKTTKPLKVGQRRVGKFDYDSNKMFDTLRDYNKFNQTRAQEEFDKFPEEVANEIDLIKKRFLSLKANGASASAEIHNQVHKDILRIKALGRLAKDEADLEKKLNRQERVENALSSIDKITGDKKAIMGKIANAYRRGFSNIGSMLNAIAGKAFAETYDPELSENRRNTATYKKTLEITMKASNIYNEKNVMRMFETMSTLDYKITDIKDGLTTELSKLEIVDIYNSIKNDKKKQDYYEAFGEDQVQTLIAKLTSQDVAFGDSLQEAVQGYREILNKRNIETTGRDLGVIENYWPATSEFQVSVIDDMRIQGETPSALKERAKTRVIPVPKNAWYKAQKHVGQAEHVDKISREYEAMKRMFTDRKVKHAIKEKYGEHVYNTLMAQIENISLNKQTERIDAISSTFQKAINNWVTAKIALNPSTYVRQLMSIGNYVEHMGPVEWTAGFFEGILHPKKTFDFMWKNAPFLEARFNKGYSEALKEAIEGAERMSVNKRVWTKFLTALVRSGDVTAIIYGGYPLMKKSGLDVFESATLKSQQSGLSSSISQFQNSRNPFTRLFLAFKNTVNQYFRKMADAIISYQNKDISMEQFAKTMTIYAVIQPIMYVAAGHATKAAFGLLGSIVGLKKDDEDYEEMLEKFLNDIMIQLIVSPVNSIPLINDAVRAAGRKATGQKVYQFLSIPWLDDLERAGRAMLKIEVTGNDYLKMMSAILEPTTGAPIGTGVRYYEILTGKKIEEKKKSTRPKIGR